MIFNKFAWGFFKIVLIVFFLIVFKIILIVFCLIVCKIVLIILLQVEWDWKGAK